jgi:hypothetical protein
MGTIRIDITNEKSDAENAIRFPNDPIAKLNHLANLFNNPGMDKIEISVNSGTAASGSLTLTSCVADDTCIVGKETFTGKDAPAGANQFLIGATDDATRDSIIAKINARSSLSGVVVASIGGVQASGTLTCSTVVADNTFVLSGTTFTAKAAPASNVQFPVMSTNTKQASAIAGIINGHPTIKNSFVATSSGAVVTIKYIGKGTVGNTKTLVGTAVKLVASGATLENGTCIVTITRTEKNIDGNCFPLAGTDVKLVASGAFLTGGVNPTKITLNKGL